MGSLYASDILWTQIGKPEIKDVLQDEGVDAPPCPPGTSCPPTRPTILDQTTLVEKLNALTGQTATTTGGRHGLQLDSTSIGDTTLTPGLDHRRPQPTHRRSTSRCRTRATATRAGSA